MIGMVFLYRISNFRSKTPEMIGAEKRSRYAAAVGDSMKIEKTKKDPRDYAPWAGMFADPKLDPDMYASLPGWRRRETSFVREQRAAGRTPTFVEIRRAREGPPVEATRVMLPASLTLSSLRSRLGGEPPSVHLLDALRDQVTRESLLEYCTIGGEGRQLTGQPPSHGLYAYIWALAQAQRVETPAIPLTSFWELEEGIYALTGEALNTRLPEANATLRWLDDQVRVLNSTVA